MSNHTITWDVTKLDANNEGCIIGAHFVIWAEDQQGHRVPQYSYTRGAPIIAENLTKAELLNWVETSVGEVEITRLTDLLTQQLAQEDIVNPQVNSVLVPGN